MLRKKTGHSFARKIEPKPAKVHLNINSLAMTYIVVGVEELAQQSKAMILLLMHSRLREHSTQEVEEEI